MPRGHLHLLLRADALGSDESLTHGEDAFDPVIRSDRTRSTRRREGKVLAAVDGELELAEFTFLSVCYTAVGNDKTPDEAIHLAVWVVGDDAATYVVEAFYNKCSSFHPSQSVASSRTASKPVSLNQSKGLSWDMIRRCCAEA
ncbi:hypothetical protein EDB19DRAFT_1824439 [Suillus lakei]|nr:hypothetical protein EDB19DRAFT_1824439 [Suillus lakei]